VSQLQKNLVTLLALALVAAGLGLYAYYGVMKTEEVEIQRKETSSKLLQLAPGTDAGAIELTRIVVTAKGETSVLEREDGRWRMVAPVLSGVDAFSVDQLSSQLQTAKFKDTVEAQGSEADLAKYGLKEPRFTVIAQARQAEVEQEIILYGGIENPFDGSFYLRREGDPAIYAVEGGLRWTLEKSPFDLRDKQALAVAEAGVTQVTLRGEKFKLSLAREGEGPWRLTQPGPFDADGQAVQLFFGSLQNERASAFLDDSPEARQRLGFDKPVWEGTFTRAEGQPVRLRIAKAKLDGVEKVHLLREEGEQATLAEISAAALVPLDKDPTELRDKSVVAFKQAEVAALVLTGEGGPPVRVERRSGGEAGAEAWEVVAPEQVPAKAWKITSALWALGSLKASAFGEERPKDWKRYGLWEPTRAVQVLGKDGADLAHLRIGAEVPGKPGTVFVRGSREQVLELETSRLTDLPFTVEDVADRPQQPAPEARAPGPAASEN
jgi:hypothetical protein